jgi:hypothetical protein
MMETLVPILLTTTVVVGYVFMVCGRRIVIKDPVSTKAKGGVDRPWHPMTSTTQGADMRKLRVTAYKPSLDSDETVTLPNKNDFNTAPHRLVTVSLDSTEARLLDLWKPSWSFDGLALFLRNNPDLADSLMSEFIPSHGKLMCNPNIPVSSPAYQDRHLGNMQWIHCMANSYPKADIQDRRVGECIFCYWKDVTQGVYYIQWDLCRYIPTLFQAVRDARTK